jgi:hypothetical protein
MSFFKKVEQEGKTYPIWVWVTVKGWGYRKGFKRVNMIEMLWNTMYKNGKMKSVETTVIGGDRIKGNDGGWI